MAKDKSKALEELIDTMIDVLIEILNDPDVQKAIPKKYRYILPIVTKALKVVKEVF